MSSEGKKINVTLTLREVYLVLCPKCQKRLYELVSKKAGEQYARHALEG